MTIFYKQASKIKQWSAFLAFLLLVGVQQSWGQTPYQLATGNYKEGFTDIANWANNFAGGIGAKHFGVAYPDPTLPNTNTVFATSITSGGVQRGTGAIALLATGTTDGQNASAFDLYLDFTGTTAGSITFDWTQISNGTSGDRKSTFKLQTNTGPNGTFVDLGPSTILTNLVPASGTETLALPAGFSNNATAKIRFFVVTSSGGSSGSRPRVSFDNLSVTAAPTGTPAASITTGAVSPTSFCITSTTAAPAFNVAYTSSGTFTGTYKVQLSDASGVFATSTTAGIIGTGSSSPISATIPAGTASGTKYRVRVLNDAPATFGSNNGTDLTVSQTQTENPVTVSPAAAQDVSTTGTGATLTASAAATSTFAWQYGTSATGPFTAIAGATAATYQLKGESFPGAGTYYLVAQATLSNACGTATGTSAPVTVTVSAPVAAPAFSVSATSLPDFSTVTVGAGAPAKSFSVSGTSLTDNIVITPPTGFEIRTGSNPFACCAIALAPVGGNVPSTTIEVRFAPTAAQVSQASIPVTSRGLPDEAVAVSGTGVEAVYPATLNTAEISDLTSTSATTGGTVAADGGSAVTARGVVWAKTANPVLGTTKTSDGAGTDTFASAIAGLLPGTTYFVRAYATNATGTAYGEERTFTTVTVPLAAEPTASGTLTASLVTGTSMQLNLAGGDGAKHLVVAHLGSAVDAEPVDATTYTANAEFGKGSVLGRGNYVMYSGTGRTVALTGLRPNTPYHFTVFAFNDNDTPYAENYLTTTPGTLVQSTQAAPTALLLEENFEYAAGSLLKTNNWAAHSGAGTNPVAVKAGGLSYDGYSTNRGNAAALVANGEDVSRTFVPVYARTPVYASLLVKVSSVTTTGDYFFHLAPQSIGSTFRGRVFVRRVDTTGKVQFGITGGSNPVTYTTAEYDLNTTHLLVLKYTFDETGNETKLFINPTADTEPTTAALTSKETGTTPGAPNDNIGTVALRQGNSSPALLVDGIRIGTTFRTVKTGSTCEPPMLAAPANLTATTTRDLCGAAVELTATAVGSPAPAITYSIEKEGVTTAITPAYLFPVGTTTVTATATNDCGTDSKTFTVTVENKQAPTVLAQNVTVALSKGTASITAAQVDNGSTDACGIATLALSKTTFSCDNIGKNTVTLTVTDIHGNTASQTATVTVTGTIPTPAIAVTPSSTVYTGGVSTNLYLGYGPQSATLTASGGVSYQWSPATGLSDATSANPVFTPTGAGTFTFTVTATNASGCTATKTVTLVVVDVQCGNANERAAKVLLCHRGKPQCVASNEVPSYLKQGDTLGACPVASSKGPAAANSLASDRNAAAGALLFEAYPNPFTDRTVVHFRANSTGPAQLQLYNSLGQVVKTFYNGIAQEGQDYQFTLDGASLAVGLYTGRLSIGGKVQTLRLVLTK